MTSSRRSGLGSRACTFCQQRVCCVLHRPPAAARRSYSATRLPPCPRDVFRASFPSSDEAAEDLLNAFHYVGLQHVLPPPAAGVDPESKAFFAAEDAGHHGRVLVEATNAGNGDVSVMVKASGPASFLGDCLAALHRGVANAGGSVV